MWLDHLNSVRQHRKVGAKKAAESHRRKKSERDNIAEKGQKKSQHKSKQKKKKREKTKQVNDNQQQKKETQKQTNKIKKLKPLKQ